MLDHLYAKFDKAYYAGLCKTIAVGENIITFLRVSQSPSLSSFRSISSHPSGFEYRGNFPPSKLGLWPSLLILVLIFDEINHARCGKNGERRCNSFIVIQARENYRLLCFHCNLVPRISEVFLHSNLRWRMNRFVL